MIDGGGEEGGGGGRRIRSETGIYHSHLGAAAAAAATFAKKDNIVLIKLPSKKIIEINYDNTACIGRNNNHNHNLTNFGKAGAKR